MEAEQARLSQHLSRKPHVAAKILLDSIDHFSDDYQEMPQSQITDLTMVPRYTNKQRLLVRIE